MVFLAINLQYESKKSSLNMARGVYLVIFVGSAGRCNNDSRLGQCIGLKAGRGGILLRNAVKSTVFFLAFCDLAFFLAN